jgi:poly-gamma-glutamate synthesis protein (capsule biosynthesis protein)
MDKHVHDAVKRRAIQALIGCAVGLFALAASGPSPDGISLAFLGDVMLGRQVASAHAGTDWSSALSALRPFTEVADLTLANLESPLTAAPLLPERLDLRAPPEAARAMQFAGIGAVSLANNHIGDAGQAGVQDTLDALQTVGVVGVGPAPLPWRTTLRGIRVTVFALDDTGDPIDVQQAGPALASWRGRADLLIVSIHWGSELEAAPNERQRVLARAFVAAGADLVIGHHPHVPQAAEWLSRSDGGRAALVVYSLGNALFDQTSPPAARTALVLLVSADRGGIRSACIVPFEIRPFDWQLAPAGEAAQALALRSLNAGMESGLPRPGVGLCP